MTRRRAFAIVAGSAVLVFAGGSVRLAAQQVPPPPQSEISVSRSGVDLAALDRNANPCDDFYKFACGGWMTKHPAPPDQPRYGRFEELQNRNNEILRDILENAAKPGGAGTSAEMQKVGDYYASCMAEEEIEKKGTAPLAADLSRVDAIKTKNDIPAVVGQMHTVGMTGFFGFGSAPDFKDATQYMLIYGQGGLGMPDRDYYFKEDANSAKLREAYVAHVARMLELGGTTATAAAAGAKTIMQIETALAKAALDRVAQRNPNNVYHKMSRDEVKKLMPNFNMSQYLERAEAPPGDSANVTEPDFMKAVDAVVAANSLADLKTYLRWHVVHSNAHMLPKRFVDENFNFYNKTLTGAQEQRPRWKRCVDAADADLGEALGKIYVERTFGTEGKTRTIEMVEGIEAALARDIDEISWMSPETKKAAVTKLRAVANKIGYPDRWRDYSSLRIARGDAYGNSQRSNLFGYRRQMAKIGKPVDKTEWLMTPPTVNAYYNPLENNINFPAGRSRAVARVRRSGTPVRRAGQPARMVDGSGWEGLRRARGLLRQAVQQLHRRRRRQVERQAHDGRERGRQRRPAAGVDGADGAPEDEAARPGRRVLAATALLHRLGADVVREQEPGDCAPARADEPAFPGRVPHQRCCREHARVRAGVQLFGGRENGREGARLPRLVATTSSRARPPRGTWPATSCPSSSTAWTRASANRRAVS